MDIPILKVKDAEGNIIEIPAIRGEKGDPGEKGEKGETGAAGKDAVTPADYVVEKGTSDNWTYRKWNSGICEAWGLKAPMLGGTTTANGFYFGYATIPLPSIFTSITTINYTFYSTSGYDFGGKIVITGTSSFNIYFGSTNSLGNPRVYSHVIGKWK